MTRDLQTYGLIILATMLIGACGRINESSTCGTLRQLKKYTETIDKLGDLPKEIRQYDLVIKSVERLDALLPPDPENSIIYDDLDFIWSEANRFVISGELSKAASTKKDYIVKIIEGRQGSRGKCRF